MVYFERAIFFSWYCSRGDCKFCYMSTQKDKIKDPKKARRSKESILAEAILCKLLDWKVEFISGGYESFDFNELVDLIKTIKDITGYKQWINMGVLPEERLKKLVPYIEGFCGSVECVNKKIHDFVCPSKPVDEIERMYKLCDKYNLKKAMNIIIGLGETIDDFPKLEEFINKHGISKITFYSLNPQKGTIFTKSPELDYYKEWIKKTRESFPDLHIIAGAWIDKPDYFPELIKAGATNITKLPITKVFGSSTIKKIVDSIPNFKSNFLSIPKIDFDKEVEKIDPKLREKVKTKLSQYISKMKKSI